MRVGLWDRYGGSVESGWIRWLLERYEFPFEVVYPQTLDAGNLNTKFDVLIFPTEAIPRAMAPRSPHRRMCRRNTVAISGSVTVCAHGSAAQSVCRGRRHGRRDRQLDESWRAISACLCPARSIFRAAGSTCPGSILRVSVDTANPLRIRARAAGRHLLRRQPGVHARCGRGGRGHPARRVA